MPEWIDHPQFGWQYLDEVLIHGAGVVGEEQLVTVWFWQKEDKDRALEILEEALARYDGDCDLNDDGDCQDSVNGAQERMGFDYPFIKYYQPGNEIGGKRDPYNQNPEEYAEFANQAAVIIKNQCPSCQVMLGSVLGGSDETWQGRLDHFEEVLSQLGHLNGLHLFDAADIHLHNMERLRYTTYKAMSINRQDMRGLLMRFAIGDREIWCTETSTYSGRPWTIKGDSRYPYQREEDQAMKLVKRYLYSFSLGIERVFWSPNLVERPVKEGNKEKYWNKTGLITVDGAKKIGYNTLQLMIDKLKGFQAVERIDLGNENLYLLRFDFHNVNRLPAYVLWKEEGVVTVDLSGVIAGEVKVTTIKGRVTGETLEEIAISKGPKFIEVTGGTTTIDSENW